MKKLSQLKIGEVGVIREFSNDSIYIKLMEMGCIPGEPVKVLNKAVLGGPISISVLGYILSLREDEADEIIIDEVNATSSK